MINVKNVKHLNICKTNATDHQDACTASEIIKSEIINVNYLRAKMSNHMIFRCCNCQNAHFANSAMCKTYQTAQSISSQKDYLVMKL